MSGLVRGGGESMASRQRSIARGIKFADMNKMQKKLWSAEHGGKGKKTPKNRKRKKARAAA